MAWEFPKPKDDGFKPPQIVDSFTAINSVALTWPTGEVVKAGQLEVGKQYTFHVDSGKIAPSVGKPNHTREDKLERILECFECNATYAEGKHDYNELLTDARKAGWLVVEKANGNYCYCPKHAAKAWL